MESLHKAATEGNIEVVRAALAAGASVNAHDDVCVIK